MHRNERCLNLTKESVVKNIWLSYFTKYLYSKGEITEEEKNKMLVIIDDLTK
jgi:hypothetical protein